MDRHLVRGAPLGRPASGSGSQNAVGTGVLGGTIAGTVLGIFFVPFFYVVTKRVFKDRPRAEGAPAAAAPQEVKG